MPEGKPNEPLESKVAVVLDHVSIPVADLDRAAAFYDAVLAAIGLERRKERPGAIAYGPASRPAPVFWILAQQPGCT